MGNSYNKYQLLVYLAEVKVVLFSVIFGNFCCLCPLQRVVGNIFLADKMDNSACYGP